MCGGRKSGNRHTDRHTHKPSNPRCACAPKVNQEQSCQGGNSVEHDQSRQSLLPFFPLYSALFYTGKVYSDLQPLLIDCGIFFNDMPQDTKVNIEHYTQGITDYERTKSLKEHRKETYLLDQ